MATSPQRIQKCPDCKSTKIIFIKDKTRSDSEDSLLQRRSYGGTGLGVGAPTICKCPNCGYESPKLKECLAVIINALNVKLHFVGPKTINKLINKCYLMKKNWWFNVFHRNKKYNQNLQWS